MKTIHKFYISKVNPFTLELPSKHWMPLSVQIQDGHPMLWVMLDDSQPKDTITFIIKGTGQDCSGLTGSMYIGTFQIEPFVFHLFCSALAPSLNQTLEENYAKAIDSRHKP